jgi:streptogramin lyase
VKVRLLLLVLAVALLAAGCGDEEEASPEGEQFGETTEQTATVDPQAPPEPEVRRIAVDGRPDAIAAGAGFVFVTDSFAGSLQRINPRSLRVRGEPVAGFPIDVAAGEGAGWVAYPDTGTVQRVDARRPGEVIEVRGFPFEIAAGLGGVWAMSQKSLERIDPGSNQPDQASIRLGGSGASVAAGEGWVWVARRNREVVRISPDDGEISETVAEVPNAFSVTTGESAAWALGAPQPGAPGTVTRIDPDTGRAAGDSVQVPDALDVAAGLGYLWVSSSDGNVRRFDPATGAQVGRPIEVGPQPQAIAIGEGALWVASARGQAVYRVTP